MKLKIEVVGMNPTDHGYANLRIVEQDETLRGPVFESLFTASNGVRVLSRAYPQYTSADSSLYLRGSDTTRDITAFSAPWADVPKILEAVDELNAKPGEVAPPKIDEAELSKLGYALVEFRAPTDGDEYLIIARGMLARPHRIRDYEGYVNKNYFGGKRWIVKKVDAYAHVDPEYHDRAKALVAAVKSACIEDIGKACDAFGSYGKNVRALAIAKGWLPNTGQRPVVVGFHMLNTRYARVGMSGTPAESAIDVSWICKLVGTPVGPIAHTNTFTSTEGVSITFGAGSFQWVSRDKKLYIPTNQAKPGDAVLAVSEADAVLIQQATDQYNRTHPIVERVTVEEAYKGLGCQAEGAKKMFDALGM